MQRVTLYWRKLNFKSSSYRLDPPLMKRKRVLSLNKIVMQKPCFQATFTSGVFFLPSLQSLSFWVIGLQTLLKYIRVWYNKFKTSNIYALQSYVSRKKLYVTEWLSCFYGIEITHLAHILYKKNVRLREGKV